MKREWLLLIFSVFVTIAISLGLLRWFAPQLLGIPIDLQMVQVSKEVPPFFDNIFRKEDYSSKQYIIGDPYVKRAKPLFPDAGTMGPNDLLGFRNRQIPNVADVITIGDSQTYGNNAHLETNWPGHLRQQLSDNRSLYNMSVGGWGAVEYLEIFTKAPYFQPYVVIIAFYTGNDALESFRLAYAHERWAFLRPNDSLKSSDMPSITFPPPENEWWPVTFADGITTIFTPKLRYGSNQDHPAVNAGYDIMAQVAREIADIATAAGIRTYFHYNPNKGTSLCKESETEFAQTTS